MTSKVRKSGLVQDGRASWVCPEHELSDRVQVFVTTRWGGLSEGLFAHNNMAGHVGDMPAHVAGNRERFSRETGLTNIQWLQQVHGTHVIKANHDSLAITPEADAALTSDGGLGLAILTADCLPIVVASENGRSLGAAHAGWRGLADGVIGALVRRMRDDTDELPLRAWIGPGIGSCEACVNLGGYEVGEAVWRVFEPSYSQALRHRPGQTSEKRDLDLALVARAQLQEVGVERVTWSNWCTYHDPRFYSHRAHQHQLNSSQSSSGQSCGGQSTTAHTGRIATIASLDDNVA